MRLAGKPLVLTMGILLLACGCGKDEPSGVGGAGGSPMAGGGPSSGGAAGAAGAGRSGVGGAVGGSGGETIGESGTGGAAGLDATSAGGGGGADAASPIDTQPGSPPGDVAPSATCQGPCTSYGMPRLLGRIAAPGLTALSGMAASWKHPEVVYVHNDRNRAEIHAVDLQARHLGRFTLAGAQVQDIEDMEVSRCPAGTCVFVADIGNNITARTEFAIYRATEPASMPASGGDAALAAERFAFRYEDGPHNAESLIVDPGTGEVYIVTKVAAGAPSAAYRLATFDAGGTNVARKVADLPVPAPGDQPATAASAHPCGTGFLLRTGNALYEFRVAPGMPFASAFAATPVAVPAPAEMQGEAVSYRADGRAYFTTSEGPSPPLNLVACSP